MDSDDLSLETTFPTDLSLSPPAHDIEDRRRSKEKMGKVQIEKKQLQYDLQVAKIELSQKSMLIDSLKSEYNQRLDDLQEQLAEVTHTKDVLATKLENEIRMEKEEALKRQTSIKNQMEKLIARQKVIEAQNEKLVCATEDVKSTLNDLAITDKQYINLRNKPAIKDMTLKEYVAMRLYEELKPWKLENEELREKNKCCTEENCQLKVTIANLNEEIDRLKNKTEEQYIKNEKLILSLSEIKQYTNVANFKLENYDKIKTERDQFELDLLEIQKRFGYVDTANENLTRERDELISQLSASEKTNTLLKHDKDYMHRRLADMQSKNMYLEERQVQLNNQLELAKQSREELYDKYVASRDECKEQYERKLNDQLDKMRFKADNEIDRLKNSAKEVYERENRSLREARDLAISERDRSIVSEKDLQQKYDLLLTDFRRVQSNSDQKIGELSNDVRLKAFEVERTSIVHEETVRHLKDCQLECEKLTKKIQVLTKECYTSSGEKEKEIVSLQSKLLEVNSRLETYEKLEKELDDVVMQAAESSENDRNGEELLFSYGYGANLPTTSKRRLQHSVQLARRVLHLEKECTLLKKEKQKEIEKCNDILKQLKQANDIVENSHQPYNYLVEALKNRDSIINDQKKCIEALENDYRKLKKDKENLLTTKRQMESDLESLLIQNEELKNMENLLNNLKVKKSSVQQQAPTQQKTRVVASSSTSINDVDDANDFHTISWPKATKFTANSRSNKSIEKPIKDDNDKRIVINGVG